MKKIDAFVLFITIFTVCACGSKNKEHVYDDGDEFTAKTIEGIDMKFKVIDADNKTCQVGIGIKGNNNMEKTVNKLSNENETIDRKYKGKVTIPQEINGLQVVCIADFAFWNCEMSKIVIPEGITVIKEDAFFMCDYLREIKLPNSLTTIEEGAFSACERLHSIYIPKNVEQLSHRIISGRYVSKITVDKDNKWYDSRGNCNAIIETSTNTLVQGCNSTIIPEGIITIGEDAFWGSELSICNIPSSTKYIEDLAFSMIGLKEIHIPQNVEKISPYAFNCYDNEIQKITVDERNSNYDSRNNCNAIIEKASGVLIRGCQNTIVPQGITAIGSRAFTGCGFKTITLPESIRVIGDNAFDRCRQMQSITLSEGLERLGSNVFDGCESLRSIRIPASVQTIGKGILKGCSSLISIAVDAKNPIFDSRNNSNAIIHTNTNSLRAGCQKTVIPKDVIAIEEDAFYGSGVRHILIPENVKEIEKNALGDARIITSLIQEPCPISHSIDTLYIPKGTKEKYASTKGWKKAKQIVELDQ